MLRLAGEASRIIELNPVRYGNEAARSYWVSDLCSHGSDRSTAQNSQTTERYPLTVDKGKWSLANPW